MGLIRDQQPTHPDLIRSLTTCHCGSPLLMFGCQNERCANNYKNKKYFYHERIKSKEELDKYWEEIDKKLEQ